MFGLNIASLSLSFLPFMYICSNTYRKLYVRLGGPNVLNFYNEVPQAAFHFAYINNLRNYIINRVEGLFTTTQKATMFVNNKMYIIHDIEQDCSSLSDENLSSSESKIPPVLEFIISTYPKQKYLKIVGNVLIKHVLLNQDLFFISFENIHLADFCAYINNRFDKNDNPRLIKLCKMLHGQSIRFPNICIKNPMAKKYLC